MVEKDILIEDLIVELPGAVTYLMEQGIRCLRCGEPIWGTLESAAKEKGFNDTQIERFVLELNLMKQHMGGSKTRPCHSESRFSG